MKQMVNIGKWLFPRGKSLHEIMNQAGAGFHRPGEQQRLLLPPEAGQNDCIKRNMIP